MKIKLLGFDGGPADGSAKRSVRWRRRISDAARDDRRRLSAGHPGRYGGSRYRDETDRTDGQTVIVENKPGAGSSLAAAAVVKSPPDGYTLYLSSIANATNPSFNKLTFDFVTDLAPVSMVADAPVVLAVHPSMPATVQDLVAEAKKKPGQLAFGSSGTGTATHLFAELFAYETAIKLTHVPYKGKLADRHRSARRPYSDRCFPRAGTVVPHIKAATLRGLAVSGRERLAGLPDIPTFAEAGVKGLDSALWFGLNTTAGTPASVIAYLNKEVGAVLNLPDVKERTDCADDNSGVQHQRKLWRFHSSGHRAMGPGRQGCRHSSKQLNCVLARQSARIVRQTPRERRLSGLLCARVIQQFQNPRRRHRQRVRTNADALPMALAIAAIGRHHRHLADAAQAVGMLRIGHLDDLGVDHRHVGRDRHAIVEEARILHPAVLAVEILLVERPADALHGAALELAFDLEPDGSPCRRPRPPCSA